MRINDFHNILELVKQDILQNESEYLKLLKVVGNNQRYDFRSQLSIYDRNSNATACAKFDYWMERFNRTVTRRDTQTATGSGKWGSKPALRINSSRALILPLSL